MVCCRVPPFTSSRLRAAAADRLSSALPHTHVLGLLEDLALGGDGGRDHQLDMLELGDVTGAADAKRGAKRAGEVLRAVVDAGGAKQDLAQGGLGPGLDARPAR